MLTKSRPQSTERPLTPTQLETPTLKLSVVIPVYNEQDTIGEVIEKVQAVDMGPISREIIISDDGSTDASARVIREHHEQATELIKVHTSPINLGKGAAVRLGLSYATGDIVIIQDADLELDPDEYKLLIAPIVARQADVVYGSRFMRANRIPLLTRLANRFLVLLTNLLYGSRLTDMETAYKAFRREALANIKLRCVRFDFEPEITAKFLRAGYTIHEVPISYNPRTPDEGKKISWIDGLEAIYTLVRCRFFD
jgi:glycosyltransferase involved in cell wall biosynthesis